MTGLKLKFIPRFPGQVLSGPGIDVEKSSGNWTVSLDYSQFGIVAPYTPRSTDYVLVYDSVGDDYFLVPASSFS